MDSEQNLEDASSSSSADMQLNVAEEAFRHDHEECIEAQMNAFDLDLVLPGHDSINAVSQSEEGEFVDLRELPDPELSYRMELSTQRNSTSSPTSSGPPTPVECEYRDYEFVLAPSENGELEEEQDH